MMNEAKTKVKNKSENKSESPRKLLNAKFQFDARINLPIQITGVQEDDDSIRLTFDIRKASKELSQMQHDKFVRLLFEGRGWNYSSNKTKSVGVVIR